jgi:hypothetical protein
LRKSGAERKQARGLTPNKRCKNKTRREKKETTELKSFEDEVFRKRCKQGCLRISFIFQQIDINYCNTFASKL